MNPYRLRSGARFAGLIFLVALFLSIGFAQKLVLERSAEWGRRSAWLGAPNGFAPPTFDPRAAAWFGDGWTGAEAGDIDGDGNEDFILLQAASGRSAAPGALARAVVIAPRGPGEAAILFDTGWARRAPAASDSPFWRPRRVCGLRLAFDGLGANGRDSGARLSATWRPASRAYHQQVIRVDPPEIELYNRSSRRGG